MLSNIDCIFVHIEKCGGSSLRKILEEYFKKIYNNDEIYVPSKNNNNANLCTVDNYNYINELPNDFKVALCHVSYKSQLTYSLCNNTFSITCVREPYKRILSHYYHFNYTKYNVKFHELNENDIMNVLSSCSSLTLRRLSGDTMDIDICKKNINEINCIIVLENIENELKELNNILNSKYNRNDLFLNIKNINKNKINYKEFFDLDINILKKYNSIFMKEIQVYNYILSIPINKRFHL
jgi:hypothetical protein